MTAFYVTRAVACLTVPAARRIPLTAAAIALGLLAGACSDSTDAPLRLSGPAGPGYDQDMIACRQIAKANRGDYQREGAMGGAVFGAVIGALDNDLEGALAGAAIGAGLGALEGTEDAQNEERAMLVRCMQNSGHPAIG